MKALPVRSTLVAAVAVAAIVTGIAAGGGSRQATVGEDIQKAIKAELAALKAVRAGKFDEARSHLEESKRALGQARTEAAKNPDFGPAASDLRQAATKDDVALDNLRARPARDPALLINQAIVRKQSAAEWVEEHTTPPAPPNRPPRVTEFKAEFPSGPRGTTTTYTVTATDPDGDPLTYTWSKQQPQKPCGVFGPNGPSKSRAATWDHPGIDQGGDCPHEGDFHVGVITVVVSDGTASCTVVDREGSKPVPAFDPGEDCSRTGKAALTPGETASLARHVGSAIELEQRALGKLNRGRRARGLLNRAAETLDGVQEQLEGRAGVDAVDRALQEARALDGEARAAIVAGNKDAARSAIDRAIDAKERAERLLKGRRG